MTSDQRNALNTLAGHYDHLGAAGVDEAVEDAAALRAALRAATDQS